jgi:tripartite tricarboxylate transporter family receptor
MLQDGSRDGSSPIDQTMRHETSLRDDLNGRNMGDAAYAVLTFDVPPTQSPLKRGFPCAREWPTESVRGSQRSDCVAGPYRGGGPAFADLLGGQVQVFFPTLVSSIEYVRAGSLRALAVATATRSEALPGRGTF